MYFIWEATSFVHAAISHCWYGGTSFLSHQLLLVNKQSFTCRVYYPLVNHCPLGPSSLKASQYSFNAPWIMPSLTRFPLVKDHRLSLKAYVVQETEPWLSLVILKIRSWISQCISTLLKYTPLLEAEYTASVINHLKRVEKHSSGCCCSCLFLSSVTPQDINLKVVT